MKSAFNGLQNVDFICENIIDVAKETIVSPANSYGFMDGGIDKVYTDFFGIKLQNAVRDKIDFLGGALPVGKAFTISTGDDRIKYLIVAPTMELPGPVPAHNCYFAMSAILREVGKNNGRYSQVYCPGLCTGVGNVDNDLAAEEMAKAYRAWIERK
ncbi:MAG: macro domain-containing protein [Clostridia bacterium]|nr:macro domain-containing protein [Clostridia bacterium]